MNRVATLDAKVHPRSLSVSGKLLSCCAASLLAREPQVQRGICLMQCLVIGTLALAHTALVHRTKHPFAQQLLSATKRFGPELPRPYRWFAAPSLATVVREFIFSESFRRSQRSDPAVFTYQYLHISLHVSVCGHCSPCAQKPMLHCQAWFSFWQ